MFEAVLQNRADLVQARRQRELAGASIEMHRHHLAVVDRDARMMTEQLRGGCDRHLQRAGGARGIGLFRSAHGANLLGQSAKGGSAERNYLPPADCRSEERPVGNDLGRTGRDWGVTCYYQ